MVNTLSLYRYTDQELKELLKSIVVIVDTREKQNQHIIEHFKNNKITYIEKALKYGDYSYILPCQKSLDINREIYFNNHITVERKASLEELSNNLAQQRERFENEFLRAKNCKKHLVIESGTFSDIIDHKYKTQLSEKSFIASLMSFQQRYNITINFIDKKHSGKFIYGLFYYHLREFLREQGF